MSLDTTLLGRVRRRLTEAPAAPTPVTVVDAVRDEGWAAPLGTATLLRMGAQFYDEMAGAGPLRALLDDPAVTDIVVNGPTDVWVDRGAGMVRADVSFPDADSVRRLAQRLAASCERRLDDASPYVDAHLPDGTRLHAVLGPIAVRGPYLSLRTFRPRAFTVAELVGAGTLTVDAAHLVTAIVRARLSYLISGGTGTGKTTLLGTLIGLIPGTERIVVVEDATELRPSHPHVVALQARLSNVEGSGAVSLRDLVRQALRMRPDRLVVGECRGAEVVEMLSALNTGHEGSAGTLHANRALDVPARLEALGLLGGLPREALHAQVAAGLQVVLHVRRGASGRYLDEVCLILPAGQGIQAVPAWRRGAGPGPAATALARLIGAAGVEPPTALGKP
jgi:pilus assembly protein CpaF